MNTALFEGNDRLGVGDGGVGEGSEGFVPNQNGGTLDSPVVRVWFDGRVDTDDLVVCHGEDIGGEAIFRGTVTFMTRSKSSSRYDGILVLRQLRLVGAERIPSGSGVRVETDRMLDMGWEGLSPMFSLGLGEAIPVSFNTVIPGGKGHGDDVQVRLRANLIATAKLVEAFDHANDFPPTDASPAFTTHFRESLTASYYNRIVDKVEKVLLASTGGRTFRAFTIAPIFGVRRLEFDFQAEDLVSFEATLKKYWPGVSKTPWCGSTDATTFYLPDGMALVVK